MNVQLFGTTLRANDVAAVVVAVVVLGGGIGAAATGVLPGAEVDGPVAQNQDLATAVSLQPSAASVTVDESTTYDVVVENADGGVGAYDFTVTVDDPSVASVTDIELAGGPSEQTTDVTVADDGSAASVVAALADTSDSGAVTIATVTVTGDDAGETGLSLSVDALGTEAGNSYTVTEANGGTLTVDADDSDEPEPEPDPANFQVSNLSAPESATQGETVDVSATVANTGDEDGTQTVEFVFDGDVLASEEVTLAGGASQQVAFSVDTSDVPAGTYTHGVSTANDTATAEITIEAPEDGDGDNGDGDDSEDSDDEETVRESAVSVQPSSSSVTVDESTTYDVVVENADGGVGAYDFTVTVDDPSVASIESVDVSGGPPSETTDVTVAEDGSTASAAVALADTSDSGSVTIATVTVTGDDAGETGLSLSVDALGTEAGNSYTVTEANGGTLTVDADDSDEPEPEPEPAEFDVSDLDAPSTVAQGETVDVSATVANTGDEDGTQTVEFVFDGDVLASEEVTLAGGASQQVAFSVDTSDVPAGTYTHGVSTDDDTVTAEITIEAPEDGDGDEEDGEESEDPAYTRDEISQAKYGHDFENLSAETAGQVEDIYNRQPFPEGTDPADIQTREEIAEERFGSHYYELDSKADRIEVQNAYDEQFGALPSDPEYTRDEISQAKYYGYDFDEISVETTGQVQAIYNRQPFPEGTDPADIQTREELAQEMFGSNYTELGSSNRRVEVQDAYHAQFEGGS